MAEETPQHLEEEKRMEEAAKGITTLFDQLEEAITSLSQVDSPPASLEQLSKSLESQAGAVQAIKDKLVRPPAPAPAPAVAAGAAAGAAVPAVSAEVHPMEVERGEPPGDDDEPEIKKRRLAEEMAAEQMAAEQMARRGSRKGKGSRSLSPTPPSRDRPRSRTPVRG